MEKLKDNLIEIIILIGIFSISIGFFIYSVPLGFISTGVMLVSLALLLLFRGGD